jgi:hydrogenase-4 component B
LTLLAVLASAGLPPLGGFVSEWLLLQSFLFAPALPSPLLGMLIPVAAALVAWWRRWPATPWSSSSA